MSKKKQRHTKRNVIVATVLFIAGLCGLAKGTEVATERALERTAGPVD